MINVIADGRFLSKPISGIGRFIADTTLALGEYDVCVQFATNTPVLAEFQRYKFKTVGTFELLHKRQYDLYWGGAHRLPTFCFQSLPKVLTVHDLVWKMFPQTMRPRTLIGEHLFFKRSVRSADQITCSSHSTAKQLKTFFPSTEKKITVVYPGVNKPVQKTNGNKGSFVLFVGTFEPRKNLFRLLQAYANLSGQLTDSFPLILAGGSGWGEVRLREWIANLELSNKVSIVSNPSDETLFRLYSECMVLVMPSLYEGFGIPIIEAMAYGKPVITSDVYSMPEISRSASILVNPEKTDQLTNALRLIMENDNLRERLVTAAKIEVKKFTVKNTAKNMKRVFLRALQLHSPRR